MQVWRFQGETTYTVTVVICGRTNARYVQYVVYTGGSKCGWPFVDADSNQLTLADAVASNDFFDAVNTGIKKFILNPVSISRPITNQQEWNFATADGDKPMPSIVSLARVYTV